MKIYNKVDELVGNTPLLDLSSFGKIVGAKARILAKLEYLNPAGSVKDRVAKSMLDDAEKKGLIQVGATIIEPTSGNTGIGLACIGASRGYKVILTMPDTMSVERRNLLKAYGAEVVLTDGKLGMQGAIKKAEQLRGEIPNSFIPSQFTNNANSMAHYYTTAREIYADTDGDIDVFVSCVGSGGTISGCGKYFKEKNNKIEVVAVEPDNSPLLSKGVAGPHGIQGIGANFVPEILDLTVIDDIQTVSEKEAFDNAKLLAKVEGVFVGISSGAALSVAVRKAKQEEYNGKTIIVILPDTGDRYLSTDLVK